MSQLEPLVNQLQKMNSFDELPDFMQQIQQQYHYAYCGFVVWKAEDSQNTVAAEAEAYSDFEKLASDLTLRRQCERRFTPVKSSEILSLAGKVRHETLVIPIRGRGMDTAALIIGIRAEQLNLVQQIAWYWSIIANYLCEAIYRLNNHESDENINLTSREHACLVWAAKGKTSWEISQILSISERTVNFHLGNCIRKTNSCNRQQAISKCVSGGYIQV